MSENAPRDPLGQKNKPTAETTTSGLGDRKKQQPPGMEDLLLRTMHENEIDMEATVTIQFPLIAGAMVRNRLISEIRNYVFLKDIKKLEIEEDKGLVHSNYRIGIEGKIKDLLSIAVWYDEMNRQFTEKSPSGKEKKEKRQKKDKSIKSKLVFWRRKSQS